jgi:hypothetical protein
VLYKPKLDIAQKALTKARESNTAGIIYTIAMFAILGMMKN